MILYYAPHIETLQCKATIGAGVLTEGSEDGDLIVIAFRFLFGGVPPEKYCCTAPTGKEDDAKVLEFESNDGGVRVPADPDNSEGGVIVPTDAVSLSSHLE